MSIDVINPKLHMKKYLLHFILIANLILFVFVSNVRAYNLGDTLGAFNAGILTPTPDRALQGIVFAQGHYWITGADPGSNWQRKLYKLSADGQNLIDFWTYNSLQDLWKGLAFDGTFLYGAGIDTIYQINMETGQRTGFKIKSPIYYNSGIAYDPQTDQFWVSGDGNIIYRINREGEITSSMAFIQDLPTASLAWDSWTPGGPYLWVWSSKYTPSDVRPKAYQMNPATGQLTGVSFEGENMFPTGADGPLGLSLSDEIIPGKVVFTALQSSNYIQWNDQLDWVVLYDLDPENSGIPGPEISVDPASIQNDLMPGDSIDIAINISNLSGNYGLNWIASLQYPNQSTGEAGSLINQFNFDSILPDSVSNQISSVVFLKDHFFISTRQGFNKPATLTKISRDGSTVVDVVQLFQSSPGGSALATDGDKIFISSTYVIYEFDPDSNLVTDYIPKTNFFVQAMAYDVQNERFFLAGGSSIKTIDRNGNQSNFYTTPYDIEGLSWDSWSSGGPYLWVHTSNEEGLQLIRINPATGMATEVSFQGTIIGTDPAFPDQPGDIFITADYQQNSLVMLALNAVYDSVQGSMENLLVYDLEVIPAPRWISFDGPTIGNTLPLENSELWVRLHAIMEDTLMTAQIVIHSNDVVNPQLVIPVNFRMLPETITHINSEKAIQNLSINKIFPNPFTDQTNVEWNLQKEGFVSIELMNMQGVSHHLIEKRLMSKGLHQLQLNLDELPAGLYLLRISIDGEKQSYTKTVIKNN